MLLVQLIRLIRRARARRTWTVAGVGLLLCIAVFGNSLTYYVFDGGADPSITFGDAVWYSIISITTIGYGDFSAASIGARLGTIVFIVVVGLTAFSVFFGLLIDWFTEMALQGERGMGEAYATGHTMIVHFPSASRVEQLVREIQSARAGTSGDVVVISDQIERLPFKYQGVEFIHGSSLSAETYQRARVTEATKAIVLATSYDDPNSDAVVASAVSVLDSIKPDLHIVAECLNDDHRKLFASVRCDAIISGLRITGNLLVQEAQDPGISRTFDVITSNLEGDTLYSTMVGDALVDGTYAAFVKSLMDHDVNVLAIVRGSETFTTFSSISPAPGDQVVYLASRRHAWDELRGRASGA